MTTKQEQAIKEALGEPDYSEVIQAIADNFNPEDVFDKDALTQWAEDNGFVKEP